MTMELDIESKVPAAAKQCREVQRVEAVSSGFNVNRLYSDMSGLYENGQSPYEELVPWPAVVDIECVLSEMVRIIRQHCILTDHEANAIALWIASSYLINSFRVFPKMSLISPEKRCGKSTTMEVIQCMSRDGLMMSNISPAVIYRMTEAHQMTLLIDEADTFIKGGDPMLVGLINSGHTKSGANVSRCVGEDYSPKKFSTWMPMVLASIGALPSTIMDRSIVINLRRKKRGEVVARLPTKLFDNHLAIRQKLARWCLDAQNKIETSLIEPPDIGNDRARDNWLPMLTVAGLAGEAWKLKGEQSYRALTSVPELELPTQLLMDIRELFSGLGADKVSTSDVVDMLTADEDKVWRQCNGGKALSAATMAKLLKPYGVTPTCMRFGAKTKRGYERSQFDDPFDRYL